MCTSLSSMGLRQGLAKGGGGVGFWEGLEKGWGAHEIWSISATCVKRFQSFGIASTGGWGSSGSQLPPPPPLFSTVVEDGLHIDIVAPAL